MRPFCQNPKESQDLTGAARGQNHNRAEEDCLP
jgi:hypothetical protein